MEIVPAFGDGSNAARPLPDSPADEMELAEDQRAFLESVYANEPEPTDEEIAAHYAAWLAREEAERIAAELELDRISTGARVAASNVAAIDALTALFGERRTA